MAAGRSGDLEEAGVQILQVDLVGLVVLGWQPVDVCLEAEVDVLGDEDGRVRSILGLDGEGKGQDAGIDGAVGGREGGAAAAGGRFEDDAQGAAIAEGDALGEGTLGAEGVEAAGDGTGVLAAFAGLALELVDLLDDLDGDQDLIVLEVQEGVGVVEEDVGVEDVVLDVLLRGLNGGSGGA
jgi:hypothetical protein